MGAESSLAKDDYPWKNHAFPFDFLFGNHIDTHQQTQLKKDGEIFGFLYITLTGRTIDGLPEARHCDQNTPSDECIIANLIFSLDRGIIGFPAFPPLFATRDSAMDIGEENNSPERILYDPSSLTK